MAEAENSDPIIGTTESTVRSKSMSSEQHLKSLGIDLNKVPIILDGTYFEIKEIIGKKLKVLCKLCAGAHKLLSSSLTCTSNLHTHLKRSHSSRLQEFEEHKHQKRKTVLSSESPSKKRKTGDTQSVTELWTKQRQPIQVLHTQSIFDKKLLKYIVNAMQPLSVVEDEDFKDIINYLDPVMKIMSRRVVGRRLSEAAENVKMGLKASLQHQQHVCTTADIWSTKHRSFMGVTVHWINEKDLSRQSAVLACRRFRGSHTFDKIAEMLNDINASFGISYKSVTSTVTDNGSNFVKAFKVFNVDLPHEEETAGIDAEILEFVEDLPVERMIDDEDELEFISPSYDSEASHSSEIRLPNHVRCASHTLSLVCTTDAEKALEKSAAFARISHASMGKCSALWTSAGKPKSAEIIQEHIQCQLRYPCPTRWNSLFDSITMIVSKKDSINRCLRALSLPSFKEAELEFLDEYITVMKPIATSLDRLQSEIGTFYGDLLPTLLSTHVKLLHLKIENRLRQCMPLLQAVIDGFIKRFDKYIKLDPSVNDAIMASLCHPFFKLRWLTLVKESPFTKEELVKIMQQKLVSFVKLNRNEGEEGDNRGSSNSSSISDSSENFFLFDSLSSKSSVCDCEVQCLNFLRDTTSDLASLDLYPQIKKTFLRYNTTLPSSAPVERLFSFAGMIHTPKRSRLSDNLFEKLVFLKGNKFS